MCVRLKPDTTGVKTVRLKPDTTVEMIRVPVVSGFSRTYSNPSYFAARLAGAAT